MKRWGKTTADEALGALLFFFFTAAAVLSFAGAIFPDTALHYGKNQSDYVLMTVQSALAVAAMALIVIADRKFRLALPPLIYGLFYVFLFCAVFLGEILSFYYVVPQWDTMLHFFSGVMMTLLGVHLTGKTSLELPVPAVAAFAFCFSLSLGALWEGYEYVMDGLFHMNMQKFADASLQPFSGREALKDTMEDILVDAVAAFATTAVWCIGKMKRI